MHGVNHSKKVDHFWIGIVDHFWVDKYTLPQDIKLSQADLCILLSNGIKNAYEATTKCNFDRKIQVKLGGFEKYSSIEIENPIVSTPVIRKGRMITSKEDKFYHGIGIENMCDVVGKHNGNINWKIKENKIKLTISWLNN